MLPFGPDNAISLLTESYDLDTPIKLNIRDLYGSTSGMTYYSYDGDSYLGNHDISLDNMFENNEIRHQYGNGNVTMTLGTPSKEWFYERIETTPSSRPQQTLVKYASNGITVKINPFYRTYDGFVSTNGSNVVTFNGETYTVVEDLDDLKDEISGGNYKLITLITIGEIQKL